MVVDCGGQGNEGRGLKWSINGGATPSLTPTHTANTDQQNKMRLSVNCGRRRQNSPKAFSTNLMKLIHNHEGTVKKKPFIILLSKYVQFNDGQYPMVIPCSREDICYIS